MYRDARIMCGCGYQVDIGASMSYSAASGRSLFEDATILTHLQKVFGL